MSVEPELDAMGKVLAALQPLEDASQVRVLRWAIEKLQLSASFSGAGGAQTGGTTGPMSGTSSSVDLGDLALPQQAVLWMKQTNVEATDLEAVFHLQNGEVDVIASSIPGKNNRERVLNCYMLAGVCELLRSGAASFADKDARKLCEAFGCLDTTNHAKYLNDKGNEFAGSKDKGWSLTAPGKKQSGLLVKAMASG